MAGTERGSEPGKCLKGSIPVPVEASPGILAGCLWRFAVLLPCALVVYARESGGAELERVRGQGGLVPAPHPSRSVPRVCLCV